MQFLKKIALVIIYSSPLLASDLPWDENAKDGDELQLVVPFLPENPIILEAGAHHGEHTRIIADKWAQGKVFAFEPVPASFAKLQQAVNSYNNIQIFPFGLFSITGNYHFNVNRIDDGSSSLFDNNHVPGVTWYDYHPINIYCMNLDEWAISEGLTHIDYMWLDMEGAELYVLQGAPNIVTTVSVISTEINFKEFRKGMSQFEDLRNLLEGYGFKLYKMWGIKGWQGTAIFIRSDFLN